MIIKLIAKLLGIKPEIRYLPRRAKTVWLGSHAKQLTLFLGSECGRALTEHMEGWQAEAAMKGDMSKVAALDDVIRLMNQYAQYTDMDINPEDISNDDIEEAIRNRIDRMNMHDKFVL